MLRNSLIYRAPIDNIPIPDQFKLILSYVRLFGCDRLCIMGNRRVVKYKYSNAEFVEERSLILWVDIRSKTMTVFDGGEIELETVENKILNGDFKIEGDVLVVDV